MRSWTVTRTEECISKEGLENSSAKIFPKGTVLVSIFASIGAVSILDIEATTNQAIAGIIPDQKVVNNRYLAYYLLSARPQLEAMSRGVAQKNINQKILKSIKVPLPTLNTQLRIVEVLDKSRQLQQKRKQANQKTNSLLQAIFLQMFGNPSIKPKVWSYRRLEELADLRGGIQLSKDRRPKGHPRPYLTIRNVYADQLDLSDVRYMEVADDELERWRLEIGDLLVLEGGDREDVGRTAMFRGELENCVHQNHVFRVRVNRDLLVPEFVMSYLNGDYVKSQFFKMAKATTGINSINMTQLKSIELPCPPIRLQKDFARITDFLNNLRQRQNDSALEIVQLFNSLLFQAFIRELVS